MLLLLWTILATTKKKKRTWTHRLVQKLVAFPMGGDGIKQRNNPRIAKNLQKALGMVNGGAQEKRRYRSRNGTVLARRAVCLEKYRASTKFLSK